jgi:hypothetical protein
MEKNLHSQFKDTYTVPDVSAEAIMESVEGICLAGEKGLSLEDVSRYIGKTKNYARRCVNMAMEFGMIKRVNNKYITEAESEDILKVKKKNWPVLFRKFLQRYKPFILFISLIDRGDSVEEASRKVKTVLNITSNTRILYKSLTTWGKYADVLEIKEKGVVKLKTSFKETTPIHIKELLESLDNELKIRVYIENKLTDLVFRYLQQDEVEFIVNAFKKHQTDSRSAIEDIGKAFEDFLRRVAKDKNINLSAATGIGQCAQTLKKADLITQKHFAICQYVNALRLAAAHSKEKVTLKPWKISVDATMEVLLTMLSLMRSIFFYVFKGEQII